MNKILNKLGEYKEIFRMVNWTERVDFFGIRRYFSKIAGNSTDTAVNLLRNAGSPLSWNFYWELFLKKRPYSRWYLTKKRRYIFNTDVERG